MVLGKMIIFGFKLPKSDTDAHNRGTDAHGLG